MKIIARMEINYFRSIYSVNIRGLNDVNVLIGGNDSGKSTVLKALNLFFNNQTELGTPFTFSDDLSRLREREARSAKGRASVWIKVTFNNFLRWESLPTTFWIKRTWNRYSARPVDTISPGITNSTVYRFLNKISFHYIPAIRGRDIFQHYLNLLHDALIEDERAGLKDASDSLMTAINNSTRDMSERIRDGLGFDSTIQVPKDLKDLFSALDFSTKFSGFDIPLQKRGDGIQARHIPFILDFVARHSKRHHIWGYEEPENSLEMGRAFELAEQFDKDFSRENQIFLTTHSPAFYDLAGTHVSKWFIRSVKYHDSDEYVSRLDTITEADADESLGIAALISSRAREVFEEVRRLRESNECLDRELADAIRAQVIVEGPSDKSILDTAFRKLYPDSEPFCEFVPAGGAPNVGSYLRSVLKLSRESVPVIGLFDNDKAGQKEMNQFRQYRERPDGFREMDIQRHIYVGMLPTPDGFRDLSSAVKEGTESDGELPLPIEFMIPGDAVNKAIEDGVLKVKNRIGTVRDNELQCRVNISQQIQEYLPVEKHYLAMEIEDSCKGDFAEWVKALGSESYAAFRPLFEALRSMIHHQARP